MSNNTPIRALFDQHGYIPHNSYSNSQPQLSTRNESNDNNNRHNRNNDHNGSKESYHNNYTNTSNDGCHSNDPLQRNEATADEKGGVPHSEDTVEASFLKAFFSHSYCLYMGPGAFLRSDLRDSPMQYFPFKSR